MTRTAGLQCHTQTGIRGALSKRKTLVMRERIDLSGQWWFQPDPYADGEKVGFHRGDYSPRHWREVRVPCDLQAGLREELPFEGTAWFRCQFDVPGDWDGRDLLLRFEAVNHHCEVWVNGLSVGTHADPFLPFELPVHEAVEFGGSNTLVVRVDNFARPGECPGLNVGWRNYGGIVREVFLDTRPRVRVERVTITADHQGAFNVQAEVIGDILGSTSLRVRVLDEAGEQIAAAQSKPGETTVSGDAPGAAPWSPESPTLHTARVELTDGDTVLDAVDVRFGFRSIRVDGEQLLLNGEPVFLTGWNRHEDSHLAGPCSDLETTRSDLETMKACGANFVRLCHYPHHPGELDLCDELGLLAMGEIPLWQWTGTDEGEDNCRRKLDAARRQLQAMIRRDVNHPSIVIWSVSNETRENLGGVMEGNRELIRLAKQLDGTRPVTHVSDHWHSKGCMPPFDVVDFAEDDVIAINWYPHLQSLIPKDPWGRQGRTAVAPSEFDYDAGVEMWRSELADLHARAGGRPVLITEFGYPALADVRGIALGEEVQNRAIEAQFAAFDQPWLCGATIWCWADHPWSRGGSHMKDLAMSPFGVVTRARRPKVALATCASMFRRRHGLEGPAPESPGPDGWPVRMVRHDLENIPDLPPPAGFSIRPMRPGEGELWEDVERDAEPYLEIRPGMFDSQFGSDPDAIRRRCFLIIEDATGKAVGTTSAWYENDYHGRAVGRIHWVAVRKAFQGRGLAKATVAFATRQLAQWHDMAILDTQTRRLAAIKIYLDLGFLPDLHSPRDAEAWSRVKDNLDHPLLKEKP